MMAAPVMIEPDELKVALSHVRWLGGGSGAGKSTIVSRLAHAHGAVLYASDAAMADHAARCLPERCPHLDAFKRMSMDERWVHRTPRAMLDAFHWFRGEAFHLIVDDLLALPRDTIVIAEGFRLLPRLVVPLLQYSHHAVWLLPTPEFRCHAFDARGSTWDMPRRTSDPERALANLLARDAMFTERLAGEVAEFGLCAIEVDGSLPETALADRVGNVLFG